MDDGAETMTKQQDETSIGTPVSTPVLADAAPVSRRLLIRGVAAAVPTILTLNSPVAAAVARTSNTISLAYSQDKDGLDRHLCVDLYNQPAPTFLEGSRYDLGEPPVARITAIPDTKDGLDRVYRTEKNNGSQSEVVDGQEMCSRGGTFFYEAPKASGNGTEWREVSVPRGMCASAIALSSYSGAIDLGTIRITEI